MKIEPITLDGVHWPRGTSARLWFCQPNVQLTTPAPFLPTHTPRSLEILRAVLDRDARMDAPEGGAPSIILLPELSIGPGDIATVRALITAARPNTLLICGVGHMTAPEVDAIEPSGPLCGEPVDRHYANCAIIGCGKSGRLILQPKVVASREELDCHWPGKVVRYFMGEYFSFVVFICSEMLNRAQARTTIHDALDQLARENRQEPVVFWLQHNPKPRSVDFSQSLEELTHLERPTVFVVASRNSCPPRWENFAVSGALFKKRVLPRHFNFLTRQFHYVEPIAGLEALSRVVLLRYDVDVNLVNTTLASAIEENDRTPRSQLFGSVFPMVMQNGALADSVANTHLVEIVRRAQTLAAESDHVLGAGIQTLTDALVALGTAKFQDFLDRGIVPRPRNETLRHAPGQQHREGDYFCDCWKHRECIDCLCNDSDAAEPVAQLLLALAKIAALGLNIIFMPMSNSLANIRLSGPLGDFDLCIVYPFNFDAERAPSLRCEAERGLELLNLAISFSERPAGRAVPGWGASLKQWHDLLAPYKRRVRRIQC